MPGVELSNFDLKLNFEPLTSHQRSKTTNNERFLIVNQLKKKLIFLKKSENNVGPPQFLKILKISNFCNAIVISKVKRQKPNMS
jgi:hypothetical protein